MSKFPVVLVPFMTSAGMTIFPFILINDKALKKDEVLIGHETIHLMQEAELLVLFFYIFYVVNYLYNRVRYKDHNQAYENICFEREAYANEHDAEYLDNRKFWSWVKYL